MNNATNHCIHISWEVESVFISFQTHYIIIHTHNSIFLNSVKLPAIFIFLTIHSSNLKRLYKQLLIIQPKPNFSSSSYTLTLKDRAPIRTLSDRGGRGLLEPPPLSRKLL